MKRSIVAVVVVGMLVGCASTPDEQKPAAIEDRQPSVADATPPAGKKAAPTAPTGPPPRTA